MNLTGFSRTLSRFVQQLQNGTTEEVIGMQDKLDGWIKSMRRLSFEPTRSVANEELR